MNRQNYVKIDRIEWPNNTHKKVESIKEEWEYLFCGMKKLCEVKEADETLIGEIINEI